MTNVTNKGISTTARKPTMKRERGKTSLGVILVAALASLLVACVDVDGDGTRSADIGADLYIAPPAPEGAASAPAGLAKEGGPSFVTSPSISPSVSVQFAAPGGTYSCASGNLCAGVWDPNAGQWKVFKLFSCTTYALSNWNGSGFYLDNQTGSPLSTFQDQSHNVIFSFFPGGGQQNFNWDPVWFIKNC